MSETEKKKRGRKKSDVEKVTLQVRVPKDIEPAIQAAATACTAGNKSAYVCGLIYDDLRKNHEKYSEAEESIKRLSERNQG